MFELNYIPFIDNCDCNYDPFILSRGQFSTYFKLSVDEVQQIKKVKLTKENVKIETKSNESFGFGFNENHDYQFNCWYIDSKYIVTVNDE